MARVREISVRFLPALAAVLALSACDPILDLKTLVEERVTLSKVSLVLYDGGTVIGPGDTVTWPDTIFGDPAPKTLTLTNTGTSNVTLTGPNVVSITGGAGAASYGGIVQPVTLTLTPGSSTTFSATFTPATPDSDFVCDFVINSNDGLNPAYVFHGTGHGTQFHGNKAIVTSPTTYYSNPQIAIDSSTNPATIYVSYLDSAIRLVKSTDGGKTWSSPSQINATAYQHSLAAANGNVHCFFMDTSTSPYTLTYRKLQNGYINWSSVRTYSANTSYYGMINSSVVSANGYVYLVFHDTTNSKLQVARSMDLEPMNMSFTAYDVTGGSTGKTGGFYPSLRFIGTTAYLSYLDSKIVMLAYSSSLSSWTYKTIYTDPTYNMGANALAVSGTNGSILYAYNSNALNRSGSTTLGGSNTWSSGAAIAGENCNLSSNLPLVYSGTSLYSIYYQYGGTSGIRFAKSSDNGTTWSQQWLDTSVGTSGAFSALAVVGSTIYAVYNTPSSHPNNYSITLKKSLDGGATW